VRSAIDSSGESVVVLGHSFAGGIISSAAADDGHPYGATTSLIYLSAFMTDPDEDVDFSQAPGIAAIEFTEDTASIDRVAAQSAFYHRCSTEDADWAIARLRAMPISALMAAPTASPAWQVLPSTYIICTDDRILSRTAQEQMAAHATRVLRIDSDHSPFLSCPKLLAESLKDIVSDS
jgi:pimeloyl-ACP methyl ester carboxylesterase